MDQSAQPATQLLVGLQRLVNDIRVGTMANDSGLANVICGTTTLLTFGDTAVSYCGESIDDLTVLPSFERVLWLLLNQSLPTEEELRAELVREQLWLAEQAEPSQGLPDGSTGDLA